MKVLGKRLDLNKAGWREIARRLRKPGDGAFVLLPASVLPDIKAAGLIGLQLTGRRIADGSEERCLIVPLRTDARNKDGLPMDAADLLTLAIRVGKGVPVVYGDERSVFAYDQGQSYRLADTLNPATLGKAYGLSLCGDFRLGHDGGFTFDALIAPRSFAEALAMISAGTWD